MEGGRGGPRASHMAPAPSGASGASGGDFTGPPGGAGGPELGAAVHEAVAGGGWRLVVTGHSLGAGAAALVSLKLRCVHASLRCFAFSPPGGLVTRRLAAAMGGWTTAVAAGKDLIPRTSVASLRHLMVRERKGFLQSAWTRRGGVLRGTTSVQGLCRPSRSSPKTGA